MTKTESLHDEIIAEVRSIRDDLAARFGYDVDRLYEEAKRREQASDREKLTVAPKRIQPVP
jgi:hypothetical protein